MSIRQHPVVSRDDRTAARKRHLAHEKEFTHMRDQLSAERRALPWLDMTPKGRNEAGPAGNLAQWVERHDQCGGAPKASAACCG